MSIWRRFAMNWHLQAMCSWACNFTKVLYLISRRTCTNRHFQHAQQFASLSVARTFFTMMFLLQSCGISAEETVKQFTDPAL
jgi:hypothetical protein